MATDSVTPNLNTAQPTASEVVAVPLPTLEVKVNTIRIDCVSCSWTLVPCEVMGYYRGQNPSCEACSGKIVHLPENLTLTVTEG